MTNRQSNIIFYSIISIIIYALIINFAYPEFFENFTKSQDELSIKEAMNKGEHIEALNLYKKMVEERKSDDSENNIETANMYEEMANLHFLLGNKIEEKNYYLKSLKIQKQLNKVDMFGFAHTYFKLGSIAEEEKQYDQAQMYYEESLMQRLGNTEKEEDENDEGMINGMHQTRLSYIRLNNEETIATFKKLGAIHNIKKEYALAKKYYEKAFAASKITFGEDDIKTLEIKNLMYQ